MQQRDPQSLLHEIDFLLRGEIDLFSSDTETTLRCVRLLSAAAEYLNQWLMEKYGGHGGDHRGAELIEQIVGAAFQTFDGEERHPDPFEKAAMLWKGITQGHPFGDGNKRTGFALASYYLDLLGFIPDRDMWDNDELYTFNMRISAGEIRDIQMIQAKLWEWWGVEVLDE